MIKVKVQVIDKTLQSKLINNDIFFDNLCIMMLLYGFVRIWSEKISFWGAHIFGYLIVIFISQKNLDWILFLWLQARHFFRNIIYFFDIVINNRIIFCATQKIFVDHKLYIYQKSLTFLNFVFLFYNYNTLSYARSCQCIVQNILGAASFW